jgi:hypothetical protein
MFARIVFARTLAAAIGARRVAPLGAPGSRRTPHSERLLQGPRAGLVVPERADLLHHPRQASLEPVAHAGHAFSHARPFRRERSLEPGDLGLERCHAAAARPQEPRRGPRIRQA